MKKIVFALIVLTVFASCKSEQATELTDLALGKAKKIIVGIDRGDCRCSLETIPDSTYTEIGMRKDLGNILKKGGLTWEKIQEEELTKFFAEFSGDRNIINEKKYIWINNNNNTQRELRALRSTCCAKEKFYCKIFDEKMYQDSMLALLNYYHNETMKIVRGETASTATIVVPEQEKEEVRDPCQSVNNIYIGKHEIAFDYFCAAYDNQATVKLTFFSGRGHSLFFDKLPYLANQRFEYIFDKEVLNNSFDWRKVEISINAPGGKEQSIGIVESMRGGV